MDVVQVHHRQQALAESFSERGMARERGMYLKRDIPFWLLLGGY